MYTDIHARNNEGSHSFLSPAKLGTGSICCLQAWNPLLHEPYIYFYSNETTAVIKFSIRAHSTLAVSNRNDPKPVKCLERGTI